MLNRFINIKRQNGASLVEFSIILPLLLLLFFGIIEWGVFMYDKAVLTNATREGARAGIIRTEFKYTIGADEITLYHPLPSTVQEEVKNICNEQMISLNPNANLIVPLPTYVNLDGDSVDLVEAKKGDFIKVVANYNFDFLFFSNLLSFFSDTYENGIPINSETIMRLE